MDELEQIGDCAPALALGNAAEAESELDVLGGGQPREERGLLKDEGRSAAVDLDGPARRRVEAGDDVEERALAAARCADETDEAAGLDRQVETIQRDYGVGAPTEDLGNGLQADGRSGLRRWRHLPIGVGDEGPHSPLTVGLPASVSSSLSRSRS